MQRRPSVRSTGKNLSLFAVVLIAGCAKEDPGSLSPAASASPAAAQAAPPAPPVRKGPPRIELNAETLIIGGDSLGAKDEWTKRLPAVLAGERIDQEHITLEVDRKTRPSAVRQLVESIRGQKPKTLTITTAHRSGNLSRLGVSLAAEELAACSATAFIGKDASVSVWAASGATAQKFAKGLGGPDMTMGGGALAKARSACPAGRVVLGADDAMIWGLLVDLVVASAPSGAKEPTDIVLPDGLVPGRKVKVLN
jgi:hypothetical protein